MSLRACEEVPLLLLNNVKRFRRHSCVASCSSVLVDAGTSAVASLVLRNEEAWFALP